MITQFAIKEDFSIEEVKVDILDFKGHKEIPCFQDEDFQFLIKREKLFTTKEEAKIVQEQLKRLRIFELKQIINNCTREINILSIPDKQTKISYAEELLLENYSPASEIGLANAEYYTTTQIAEELMCTNKLENGFIRDLGIALKKHDYKRKKVDQLSRWLIGEHKDNKEDLFN